MSYILSIDEDKHGSIWLATIGGLAKLRRNNTWVFYDTLNSGLPSNAVYEVRVDKNQDIWAGTEKGLARFDGSRWTVYSSKNSPIKEDYIHHFAIDDQNNLWLCNSFGLHWFNGKEWKNYNKDNSLLPENAINFIEVDKKNNKWIGTFFGGLIKIDSEGNWTLFNQDNSPLLNNNVTSIFIDDNNNKWIGTFTGLNVFNENGIDTVYIAPPKESFGYELSQNYPNPFNASSLIDYDVPVEDLVEIRVYDILGSEVMILVNEVKSPGRYSTEFNGAGLPSGVYFIRMQTGAFTETRKAIFLK